MYPFVSWWNHQKLIPLLSTSGTEVMLGTHESLEMLGRICGKRHAKNHDFPRQQKELNVFHDCFFHYMFMYGYHWFKLVTYTIWWIWLLTSPRVVTGMMGIGFGESSPNCCKSQLFWGSWNVAIQPGTCIISTYY